METASFTKESFAPEEKIVFAQSEETTFASEPNFGALQIAPDKTNSSTFTKVDWTSEQIAGLEARRAEEEAYILAHPYVNPDANYFTNRIKEINRKAIEEIKRSAEPYLVRSDEDIRLGFPGTTILSSISPSMIPDLVNQYTYAVTKETNISKLIDLAYYYSDNLRAKTAAEIAYAKGRNRLHCPTAAQGIYERIFTLDPYNGLNQIQQFWDQRKNELSIIEENRIQLYRYRQNQRAAQIKAEESTSSIIANVITFGGYGVAKYAGRAICTGIGAVGDALAYIPIVGKAFHAVLDLSIGPIKLAENITDGKNVIESVANEFNQAVSNVRDAASVATMVMAYIPGIGTGVACAINVGISLAEGKDIDDAIVNGVSKAIPVQPYASYAILAVVHIAEGHDISEVAIDSIGEASGASPTAIKALKIALPAVKRIANGENVGVASLDATLAGLPPSARTMVQAGIAVGTGKKVQGAIFDAIVNNPDALAKIGKEGAKYIGNVPVMNEIANTAISTANRAPSLVKQGFNYGIGMMRSSGVTDKLLSVVRSKLQPDEQAGFDAACAAYTGAVIAPKPPAVMTNKALAGYLLTYGATKLPKQEKLGITSIVTTGAEIQAGAILAAKQYKDALTDAAIAEALAVSSVPDLKAAILKASIANAIKEAGTPQEIMAVVKTASIKPTIWIKIKRFFGSKG